MNTKYPEKVNAPPKLPLLTSFPRSVFQFQVSKFQSKYPPHSNRGSTRVICFKDSTDLARCGQTEKVGIFKFPVALFLSQFFFS